MPFEHKDGCGSLFANTNKNKESQPDYRGDFQINGEIYEIAGWTKTSRNNERFMSLQIKPKESQQQSKGGNDDAEAFF